MEIDRRQRSPAPAWLGTVAVISAVIAALCTVTIDRPLVVLLSQYEPSPVWGRVLDLLEWTILLPTLPWMSAIVLELVMIAMLAVNKWRRYAPAWIYLSVVHVVSLIAVKQIKLGTDRIRPKEWLAHGGPTFFAHAQDPAFPSGHVVLFASLIIPAMVVWPKARPLLVVLAFVMLARVAVSAHYASDVMGGVALVALVAWLTGWVIRPIAPPRTSRR